MSPELWILARRETGADGGTDLAPLSPALRHCHLTGAVAESQKCHCSVKLPASGWWGT